MAENERQLSGEQGGRPDLYAYEDYRRLLADCFAFLKARDPKTTCRSFAAKAGIGNPGFLNDVIRGRRRLSGNAAERLSGAFGFRGRDAQWFRLLVDFGQAKDSAERDRLYRQMLFCRSRSRFARLQPVLAKYYQDWRYPLLRLAVEVLEPKDDWNEVADYFDPPMRPAVVRRMVADLVEWGLVSVGEDGRHRATSRFVEPSPTLNEQVRELNREWLRQAEEAVVRLGPEERHVSTAVVNLGADELAKLLESVEELRARAFSLSENCAKPDRTVQLSVAVVPKGGRHD